MGRFDILHEIERLDPERDHQRIMHLSFGYEFPWDSVRALEIALYRTYCIPSISKLLDRTGEFSANAQRRYDDTAILVAEMCEWGYEQGRGKGALERTTGRTAISRSPTTTSCTCFNVHLGAYEVDRRVLLAKALPERAVGVLLLLAGGREANGHQRHSATFEGFEAWAAAYEKANFRFADTNQRVGAPTRDLFASWTPRGMVPFVRYGIYALLDDDMRRAFGFPNPLPLTQPMMAVRSRCEGVSFDGCRREKRRTSSPTIRTARIRTVTRSVS